MVQVLGEKVRGYMKLLIDNYTDAPSDVERDLEHFVPIENPDFIPSPEDLVLRTRKQRVSIMLDTDIIDYFKVLADKNGVKYQSLINNLLSSYVHR